MRANRHTAPATVLGALLLAGCTLGAAAAAADEVTSKGTVLRGKVVSFSSGGVVFEPEYGKGALVMKWADIEDMKTDKPFQVLHGEDQEAAAPVQGVSDASCWSARAPARPRRSTSPPSTSRSRSAPAPLLQRPDAQLLAVLGR